MRHAVAALHGEVHLPARQRLHVDRAHLRVLAEAVAGDRALRHRARSRARRGRRRTGWPRRRTACGAGSRRRRAFSLREVVAVGVHVVGVDVGHHRHHRHQVQERRVGLVGLDHDVVAAPSSRVGAGAVQARRRSRRSGRARPRPARWPPGWWSWSCRACRRWRCPASGASARPASPRAAPPGSRACARGDHLGVVGLHRGGRDHRVGAGDVGGVVADAGLDAQRRAGGAAWRCRPGRSRRSV